MDKHYENLAMLYLRLKGFIVSNLIIHSVQQGNLDSELDIIGYRMPHHKQEDRKVNIEDELECSESRIEVIIADVKNTTEKNRVKFNKGLRKSESSIIKLINWIGCFPEINEELISDFKDNLNLHRSDNLNGFAKIEKDYEEGKYSIKFTFFCPSLEKWNEKGFKYINGQEMIDFIWECLNNKNEIITCSRQYDFTGWNELEDYIRFFKYSENKVTLASFESYYKAR
jgi:hypothetical protein